jgi:hypothetical protein
MASVLTITPKELERQAVAVFEGKTYKIFLAVRGALTVSSTAAEWEAAELSGNGYAAVTGTIGTGSYNAGNTRYELPNITAQFSASGAGYTYDTMCFKLGSETYLHSINVETPSITLAAGQSKSYVLQLAQDD